jgi:hypothetical protein
MLKLIPCLLREVQRLLLIPHFLLKLVNQCLSPGSQTLTTRATFGRTCKYKSKQH